MAAPYQRTLAGLLAGTLAVVAIFNWLADPYSIYGAPKVKWFNADKVEFVSHLRLTKAHRVATLKPSAIILGSSRAGHGLDPDHPGWEEQRVYNLAIPSPSMYEIYRYFQHANAVQPLKRVVLVLDYRSFTKDGVGGDFSEERMAATTSGMMNPYYIKGIADDLVDSLLSMDALSASLRNARRQGWPKDALFDNGRWDRVTDRYDHRKAFFVFMGNTLRRLKERVPYQSHELMGFDYLRDLIRICHQQGVDLRILISPSHAWHWEAFRVLGLWPQLEDLKRTLVHINEREAARAGKPPFPLYDFSGDNSLTTEAVPAAGNPSARMHWFWDSVHYKKALGDVILNRVLGDGRSGGSVPSDFGISLRAENVEPHLARLRAAQRTYADTHPEDIEIIERLAISAHATQR